jgi:hypothetical protein
MLAALSFPNDRPSQSIAASVSPHLSAPLRDSFLSLTLGLQRHMTLDSGLQDVGLLRSSFPK